MTTLCFSGRTYERADFSNQDLTEADFSHSKLAGSKFDNSDLSFANFEGADCRGCSFRQAKLFKTNFKDACLRETLMDPRDLFGSTITIHCQSTGGMKISRLWAAAWLHMLLIGQMGDQERKVLMDAAEALIGKERMRGIERAFSDRDVL